MARSGTRIDFIANCPDNDSDQEQGNKREKKKNYKKAKGEAHLGKEWDSDCSSSDSDNEGLAATAFNKSALFPNEHHTCLMAREKKVSTRDTSTYASSSDEESSDDAIDYSCLFKGLDRTKVDKINELIDALIVTRNKGTRGKRRRLTRRLRARHTLERSGTRIARRPTPTTKDSPPPPSTSRPSSPMSITPASWRGKRR